MSKLYAEGMPLFSDQVLEGHLRRMAGLHRGMATRHESGRSKEPESIPHAKRPGAIMKR